MSTIAQRVEKLLPQPETRRRSFRAFADAMYFIHERKPEWALVRFDGEQIRLFAGKLIVLTVRPHGVWLAVPPSADPLSELESWQWDRGRWAHFRRVPSRNGYYRPEKDPGHEWIEIRREHFEFLETALNPGVAPDPRTVAKHQEAVAIYVDAAIRGENGSSFLPVPDHDVSAIEGQPRLVSHLRRERNPTLAHAKREAVRDSSGKLYCEACEFEMSSAYPALSGDICEVHHRTPLSAHGGGTKVGLDDLAILCPNCHRAIHRTDPLMSVEEFRATYLGDQSAE